jgi:AraC family transcriptional regulator
VPLTEVALACGFASSSDFSRSFRATYGVPPSAFDVDAFRDRRREALPLARLPPGENPDGFAVAIRKKPPRRVAYLRVLRPYEGTNAADAVHRLIAWARARGLDGGQWLGYQWDDPEIVALEDCRYDVGVEVPAGTTGEGDVAIVDFPAMTLAEIDIAGPIQLEMRAIDWLYGTWLPTSGWAPDHHPGFEAWKGLPFAHGTEHFEIAVQLAVVAAAAPL